MKNVPMMLPLLALILALAGCGGGGGATSQDVNPPQSTGKSATISFSVLSTARLTAPVQGVQLSAFLPEGVTVATTAGSSTVSSTALITGVGITSSNRQIYGTYSAPIRKVKITVATTEETFRGGEFAKLSVNYPSTINLTANDFASANEPTVPFFQAAGYVVGTGSVDLTGKLRASLGVLFN